MEINMAKLDETISVTECKDGFWLYDTTRGMNLSMRAPTKDQAFFEALKYYQNRLLEVENDLNTLQGKVNRVITELVGAEVAEEGYDQP
jgi:hypothetical protein